MYYCWLSLPCCYMHRLVGSTLCCILLSRLDRWMLGSILCCILLNRLLLWWYGCIAWIMSRFLRWRYWCIAWIRHGLVYWINHRCTRYYRWGVGVSMRGRMGVGMHSWRGLWRGCRCTWIQVLSMWVGSWATTHRAWLHTGWHKRRDPSWMGHLSLWRWSIQIRYM